MTLPVLGECLYKAALLTIPFPPIFFLKLIADLGEHGFENFDVHYFVL